MLAFEPHRGPLLLPNKGLVLDGERERKGRTNKFKMRARTVCVAPPPSCPSIHVHINADIHTHTHTGTRLAAVTAAAPRHARRRRAHGATGAEAAVHLANALLGAGMSERGRLSGGGGKRQKNRCFFHPYHPPTGLLALPFAFRATGLALATLLIATAALAARASLRLLLASAGAARTPSLAGVARAAFGPPGAATARAAVAVLNFVALVAYVTAVGDTLGGAAAAAAIAPPRAAVAAVAAATVGAATAAAAAAPRTLTALSALAVGGGVGVRGLLGSDCCGRWCHHHTHTTTFSRPVASRRHPGRRPPARLRVHLPRGVV